MLLGLHWFYGNIDEFEPNFIPGSYLMKSSRLFLELTIHLYQQVQVESSLITVT